MVRPEKQEIVRDLEERFQNARALVFTDFRGLTANEMVALRQRLAESDLDYKVVKNRLALRAAESAGVSMDSMLEGPTGICFGYDDPVVAFKQSVTLADEFPNYEIKGGLIEGEIVDAEAAKEIAELPSHEELVAQLVGAVQGPIRSLAGVLNNTLQKLVIALDEVAKVKPDPESADTDADASDATAADEADEAEASDASAGEADEADEADEEPTEEDSEDSETEKGETS